LHDTCLTPIPVECPVVSRLASALSIEDRAIEGDARALDARNDGIHLAQIAVGVIEQNCQSVSSDTDATHRMPPASSNFRHRQRLQAPACGLRVATSGAMPRKTAEDGDTTLRRRDKSTMTHDVQRA